MSGTGPSEVTTPSGVRVMAHLPDGTEVNVTEGVMALYDLVIGSMDWGSGFLTVEDATPVVHVARTCGFPSYEEAERYVNAQAHSEEQRAFLTARQRVYQPGEEHDHVFSSVGKCIWPRCSASDKPGDR